MGDLRISEIFGPTIQGEGALIGEPTVFVRAGGCDFRCSWCDTLYAVESEFRHQWKPMTAEAILARVEELSGNMPLTISLSGGNPAIQDFGSLIDLGKEKNYSFALETQGSVARDWFSKLEILVLSPKPPSSGEEMDWTLFDQCIENAKDTRTVLKIVIFDEIDYQWAKDVAERYPDLELFLQPGNHTPPPGNAEVESENDRQVDLAGIGSRLDWLIERSLQDKWFRPRILPQLHVLLWGNKRGV